MGTSSSSRMDVRVKIREGSEGQKTRATARAATDNARSVALYLTNFFANLGAKRGYATADKLMLDAETQQTGLI